MFDSLRHFLNACYKCLFRRETSTRVLIGLSFQDWFRPLANQQPWMWWIVVTGGDWIILPHERLVFLRGCRMEIGASFELSMFSKAFVWRIIAAFEERFVPSAMFIRIIGVMWNNGYLKWYDPSSCTARVIFRLIGRKVWAYSVSCCWHGAVNQLLSPFVYGCVSRGACYSKVVKLAIIFVSKKRIWILIGWRSLMSRNARRCGWWEKTYYRRSKIRKHTHL